MRVSIGSLGVDEMTSGAFAAVSEIAATLPPENLCTDASCMMQGTYAPIATGLKPVNDTASWLSDHSTLVVAACAVLGLLVTVGKRS